jgi:DNA (cytosine-5)-methyltransferase 1
MTEQEILEKAYEEATQIIEYELIVSDSDLDKLIEMIDSNKSLVSALVTSLVKKTMQPAQDVRLHRVDFDGGYSARSLDTQYTSPFFKQVFSKYANKESSFLTLATRERLRWDLVEGQQLKIRNKTLKTSFLNLFERIEGEKVPPFDILAQLFARLILLSSKDRSLYKTVFDQSDIVLILNIRTILEMLEEHFNLKMSSRLPVIAIYSIYELLMERSERYKNKKLLPLQVHTSSDKHGFGDIEIYNLDHEPFEIIEIKHNKPIDRFIIFDILKKTERVNVKRYYVLTTYKNSFETLEEEIFVGNLINRMQKDTNMDIITNGIITTLKYYLRFLDDYDTFIKNYTKNLIIDSNNSTEIKSFHIENWMAILKKYEIT